MARVPASLALMLAPMLALSLSLAACGSPQPTADKAADRAAAPEAEAPTQTQASVQSPIMPDDAPPQEEEHEGAMSCSAERGEQAAVRLAERCTMVSPASHPPCNPANPCALIQDEIDRACGQYGPGEAKPAECAA